MASKMKYARVAAEFVVWVAVGFSLMAFGRFIVYLSDKL